MAPHIQRAPSSQSPCLRVPLSSDTPFLIESSSIQETSQKLLSYVLAQQETAQL